jgi:YHS domain-containing protein
MIGNSMTTAGEGGKSRRPARAAAVLALLCGLGAAFPLAAATTERVVVDRHSGLAISGFDPVAYFTDGRGRPGKGELEEAYAGAVWRFCNEGNLAAFAAAPDIYMPQFGGYDPTGLARGVPVPGNPRFWLVWNERLYLFYSGDARDAFAQDSASMLATAIQAWGLLQPKLVE